MGSDDRPKLTYSERDRRRREGGGAPDRGAPRRSKGETEKLEQEALKAADQLFTSERGGQRGKVGGESGRLVLAKQSASPT